MPHQNSARPARTAIKKVNGMYRPPSPPIGLTRPVASPTSIIRSQSPRALAAVFIAAPNLILDPSPLRLPFRVFWQSIIFFKNLAVVDEHRRQPFQIRVRFNDGVAAA